MFATSFIAPQVEEARSGTEPLALDACSLRTFFEDALPRVYGYFLHRCGGSVVVAEDLTQDTFLAAARELKKGRHVESPLPWIYGVARHKLLDHYRRQQRFERHLTIDPDSDFDEIPVEVGDNERRERAASALTAVAAQQRAALVLFYMDGLSAAETADALGTTATAVNSLLQRGRASFKHAYLEALT